MIIHKSGSATVTTYPATEAKERISAADRCDQCGAQAYVRCYIDTERTPLLFCAHHYDQHETELVQVMTLIGDCRSLLTHPERLQEAQ